jgi:4-diphosphocytidyl-2-C-methyl-D-erythritol kinase
VRVRAFAKINRSLRVLATRGDGYHELRTIFQSIALHDTLTIRAARRPFALTCDDPACPVDDSNLIARAAAAMRQAAGRRGAPTDVAIHLTKRIPMQAGLGGGSSDAAATLRALGRMWRVGDDDIRAAARSLGADVPYFFEGGAVLGLDRGDLLFPLAEPAPASVVLVLPDFGVSTSDAFGWFDRRQEVGPPPRRKRAAPHRDAALAIDGGEMVNDLEAAVVARHPEIGRIVLTLRRAGASQAAMSGSGSAVFGLFSSRSAADRAAKRLQSSSRRIIVTRTLSRKTYQRLAAT